MENYPESSELEDYQNRLPKISQQGPFWCIPASVENMLKYVGINEVTQENMVLNYCRKFGKESLVVQQNGQYFGVDVSIYDDKEVIKIAKDATLRNANFGTIKETVENSAQYVSSKYRLHHITNIIDSDAYLELLKKSISSQEPVLIASTNQDGSSHIRVVVTYSKSEITLFDPAIGNFINVSPTEIKFNSDILILKRNAI